MLLVLCGVIRVDQDVEVNGDANVNHVMEDVVHKTLESSRGIGEAKWHHHPLKKTIACLKRSFPFITVGDLDQMVSMSEVDFDIDASLAGAVQEVGDQGKGILVLGGDLV